MTHSSGFLPRFQKAAFPLIMAGLAFLCFIAVYTLVVTYPISPFYLRGLWFGIPTICFVIIAVLVYQGLIKTSTSMLLTIIMTILSLFLSIGGLVSLAIESDSSHITDVSKYERVLSRLDDGNNAALALFPNAIPEQAEDAQLLYHPAFMQGGALLCLTFQTEQEVIQNYQAMLSRRAIRIGDPTHLYTEETGITESALSVLADQKRGLPKDFTLYFTYCQPSQPNNWNHGTSAFVATSESERVILFYYESW